MHIIHALHRAGQESAKLFAEATDGATTPTQAIVLAAIDDLPGPTQSDLVEATGVDRSTLADVVRRMQRQGLLQRRRNKEDRRSYKVTITSEGRRVLGKARTAASRVEGKLVSKMPALSTLID